MRSEDHETEVWPRETLVSARRFVVFFASRSTVPDRSVEDLAVLRAMHQITERLEQAFVCVYIVCAA